MAGLEIVKSLSYIVFFYPVVVPTAGVPTTKSRWGGKPRASAGDLWGQIKPCWDQLPSVSIVSVTLVIKLDNEGRIAKPPQIVRPRGAALDERRLIAEALALAAVTACTPYLA